VQYTIGKTFFERFKIFPSYAPNKVFFKEDMNIQSFKTIKVPILGLPRKKCHLDVALKKSHRV
jgi:hypothetical protein